MLPFLPTRKCVTSSSVNSPGGTQLLGSVNTHGCFLPTRFHHLFLTLYTQVFVGLDKDTVTRVCHVYCGGKNT